jgi:hypothetical protein
MPIEIVSSTKLKSPSEREGIKQLLEELEVELETKQAEDVERVTDESTDTELAFIRPRPMYYRPSSRPKPAYRPATPFLPYLPSDSQFEKSFWYFFVGGVDREQDVIIIKEILFWHQIYHKEDTKIEILVPNSSSPGSRYNFLRRSFEIVSLPTLVLTDRPIREYPGNYIKLSNGFLVKNLLGEQFEKLRDVMDYLHNSFLLTQSIDDLRVEIFKKHISTILLKTWMEIKDVISITIG